MRPESCHEPFSIGVGIVNGNVHWHVHLDGVEGKNTRCGLEVKATKLVPSSYVCATCG